ncbi:MAG: retroviral-like aspartic protease family protein [Chloroflexi bacterium]|nr:retroviral-like aspartic protease family protein [Chloroflexota bacterium]
MATYAYNASFDPPAPVLPVKIGVPLSSSPPVTVNAFVDSGADITAIPSALTRQLQMRRADTALLRGFEGKVRESPVFSVTLATGEGEHKFIRAVLWQETYALLGRDLLNQLEITLDGLQGVLHIVV